MSPEPARLGASDCEVAHGGLLVQPVAATSSAAYSLAGLWPEVGEATSLQAILDRARRLELGPEDLPGGAGLARRLRSVNHPEDLAR